MKNKKWYAEQNKLVDILFENAEFKETVIGDKGLIVSAILPNGFIINRDFIVSDKRVFDRGYEEIVEMLENRIKMAIKEYVSFMFYTTDYLRIDLEIEDNEDNDLDCGDGTCDANCDGCKFSPDNDYEDDEIPDSFIEYLDKQIEGYINTVFGDEIDALDNKITDNTIGYATYLIKEHDFDVDKTLAKYYKYLEK